MTSEYTDRDGKVKDILSRLTTEEKVSLLAGQDFWRTMAIPEHGIPPLKVTDGPNGARGEFFTDGTPAALFPCGVSLAATWNVDVLREIGNALAAEAKAKQAQVLLAPTVCMHRSPLGGRNFESFSEDPYITGKLASAYISGLQEKGVGATIKHFVANEQETWRMSVDAIVEERPLREIYLKPFEIAVREAKPWAVMSSYNLVNGKHADMNEFTLNKVLRGEWDYKGVVMSDWTGTNSTVESIKCGVDLEMPGPAKVRGQKVLEALERGELTLEEIEQCAARVLHLVLRSGRFDMPLEEPPEKTIDNEGTSDLIRRAGGEGITLLKNENSALPINDAKKIALIGPNAHRAVAGGGGSASLKPYYLTTPFESLTKLSGKEVVFAEGVQTQKWLPLASAACVTADNIPGVTLEFFKGDKFEGSPVAAQHRRSTELFLWDSAPPEVLPEYSFRIKTYITAEKTGYHIFGITTVGPAKLYIDGSVFIDSWDWTEVGETMFQASVEATKEIYLEAGRKIEILVESTNEIRPIWKSKTGEALFSEVGQTHTHGGARIGYMVKPEKDLLAEAVEAAASADVAIVVVGLDAEWESEGYDRQTMDLPKNGSQDKLISAVFAANPRTIVVNQSGTPVTMPWAHQVPAIVQAWYQGQEAGNALADVLLGTVNPSGKLPVTFPVRLEDNPAYHNWPGEDKRVVYGEGLFIGYRHYERVDIKPLFPFGHGLSYTTFEYGKPTISSTVLTESNSLVISVPVTNTGSRRGKEVVQLYIRDMESRLPRPKKELQGFVKVDLDVGETKVVTFEVGKLNVGYFDGKIGKWIAEKGEFVAVVGASSVDVRGEVRFEVKESCTWIF